jgi:hypothetical protein
MSGEDLEDFDWFAKNLPRLVKSEPHWAALVKQVTKSKSTDDLEEIRAAAQELHDPTFGREASSRIAPWLEELVYLINARLRTLRPRSEADQPESCRGFWARLTKRP